MWPPYEQRGKDNVVRSQAAWICQKGSTVTVAIKELLLSVAVVLQDTVVRLQKIKKIKKIRVFHSSMLQESRLTFVGLG